ncbi:MULTISPECIES: LysM peptidoglycan-binding domain-containing protein [Lactiplantibacillus]|uniref:Putative N-acetylmuramidase n=5 Tax=Lactiplantibacillus plantarum TaxID=1590 RepID=A0A2S3U607_LACPN|nr:LysM peptidoglycan-binding domain-containing protein [Lactiplantibacillus plantarum]POD85028.1 putative N-acetylmuramidase [Lactiplantibacillus plantarum subsp. plantarum]MBW2757662.1 LysM peptidoglycan-binding domain-containing protein [Lactiplantibacillus plantarum]MBY8575806.1 LysM peptidoglycan-binding domain-containing protein [Lactiplantibacillus plantarum]MDT7022708.1 LysM peptidoglycan-binding domain-containing protein [Lactiplantibacillus plantarum]QAS01903.1 LysM domain-containing
MKIKNLVLSSTAALALFAISTTVANADTYTVKAGDTVSAIAQAHNTSVSAIEKANKLANVNLIFIGDKLEVNGTTTTTTTSAATSAAPQSATSQATSSVASTATSASATSASSQSVASQATSSAATSSAASQASSSAATTSQASSSATSSAASSTASTTSTTSSYTGSNLKSYVLSQMQSRTGVSASTWNTIITRESNWNSTVKNSTSGAYGLFQNMHISSGSVEDQVNAAVSLYNAQGMAAWAL